jgi:hypothetical protein
MGLDLFDSFEHRGQLECGDVLNPQRSELKDILEVQEEVCQEETGAKILKTSQQRDK